MKTTPSKEHAAGSSPEAPAASATVAPKKSKPAAAAGISPAREKELKEKYKTTQVCLSATGAELVHLKGCWVTVSEKAAKKAA
jgi:hypothetical protein